MTSQFLLRPRPEAGESLSSWRQRVGWANGYTLFPLDDGRLRRADPDLGLYEADFFWIATTHAITIDSIRAMTFRYYLNIVTDRLSPRCHPPWWLRARYGKSARPYGAMYCPECLAEDREPFFRLSWRIALNTRCTRHAIRYRDSCPDCHAPPWPAGCAGAAKLSTKFTSFANCWRCGASLTKVTRVEDRSAQVPEAWLKQGETQVGLHSVGNLELLAGLRAICQVFIRNRARRLMLRIDSKWSGIAERIEGDPLRAASVEQLGVDLRGLLIPAALDLLGDWPDRFVDFADQCGIARAQLNAAGNLQPEWMSRSVDQHLARQNRWVTEERVRETIAQIKTQGEQATKAEIRRRLAWQGDIPDAWLGQ
jgi:hypothetical protein